MIEKVNPSHPDKIADRIAGALVDYAYTKHSHPSVAVEVLIGHGSVNIIAETSVHFTGKVIFDIVHRIAPGIQINYKEVPQDPELAKNQSGEVRAGDNGIFKGVPLSFQVKWLSKLAHDIYKQFPSDGKYVVSFPDARVVVCQSNATDDQIKSIVNVGDMSLVINPLGFWTGGIDVDTGAVNRKLGSDMGEAVTGGGLHGKDLSKADVSVNIYAHLLAQDTGDVVELHCAIGDESIDGVSYDEIVSVASKYIKDIGGFEKLAEWGLV